MLLGIALGMGTVCGRGGRRTGRQFVMHQSSLENMALCFERYAIADLFESDTVPTVLDLGALNVNGSYRDLIAGRAAAYVGADLSAGEGVDVVTGDGPLPFADGAFDLVLSGQMLEHCRFFWATFAEMARVLSPRGRIFLIAPSAGPIHRYPVDCYRFYPDAYQALADYAGLHLTAVWRDERGPWQDLVGVFAKDVSVERKDRTLVRRVANPPVAAGDDEERVAGARPTHDVLAAIHSALKPSLYLEIGVNRGASLALARGPAVAIDPFPHDEVVLPENATFHRTTSDDFFRDRMGSLAAPPDFALIDGMHAVEFVLRDFMNLERAMAPHGLIAIDDVLPNHERQAAHERGTRVWTGDVFRIADILANHRPDLFVVELDTRPTGLMLVAGLDRSNRVLWDKYNPIVARVRAEAPVPSSSRLGRTHALEPSDALVKGIASILSDAAERKRPPKRLAAQLREAVNAKAEA